MILHMSLIDLAEKYQTAQGTYYLVDKKRTPTCSRPLYIYFIFMVCAVLSLILFILLDHAFSIRTSFSRTNTFEIHSISTSKSLIHLITDGIKKLLYFWH